MNHFIEVVGSYDAVFVGPFTGHWMADQYVAYERRDRPQFDYCVVTEAEMQESLKLYGDVPVQAPEHDPADIALRFIEEALGPFPPLPPIGWEHWFGYAASGEWR